MAGVNGSDAGTAVAVLGAGIMGSAMARNLVAAGLTTRVWDRAASAPRPDDHVIVLLGATGDLARRKLLPGLFGLFVAGLLPDNYRIVGSARRPR